MDMCTSYGHIKKQKLYHTLFSLIESLYVSQTIVLTLGQPVADQA